MSLGAIVIGPNADYLTLLLGGRYGILNGVACSATPTIKLDPVVAQASAGSFPPELPEVTDLDRRRIADADHKRRMRDQRRAMVARRGGFG